MYFNSIQFKFHSNVVHALIKYRNELMSFVSRTFGFFSCFIKICFFLLMFLVLVQIRRIYCMLHMITSYHYYMLVEIHLCQG
jgi:hypothetical protein